MVLFLLHQIWLEAEKLFFSLKTHFFWRFCFKSHILKISFTAFPYIPIEEDLWDFSVMAQRSRLKFISYHLHNTCHKCHRVVKAKQVALGALWCLLVQLGRNCCMWQANNQFIPFTVFIGLRPPDVMHNFVQRRSMKRENKAFQAKKKKGNSQSTK